MANEDSKLSSELPSDHLDYCVLTLRAQLRGAMSLLTTHNGYGNPENDPEDVLCSVGCILRDADIKLGEIYTQIEEQEVLISKLSKGTAGADIA